MLISALRGKFLVINVNLRTLAGVHFQGFIIEIWLLKSQSSYP
jgi:hypothetical protein